jgi:hypothetical protein
MVNEKNAGKSAIWCTKKGSKNPIWCTKKCKKRARFGARRNAKKNHEEINETCHGCCMRKWKIKKFSGAKNDAYSHTYV